MDRLVLTRVALSATLGTILKEIRDREGPDRRKVLNDSQFEVVKKVADRVCDEMDVLVSGDHDSLPEPLRWSMHGGPGTGKHM